MDTPVLRAIVHRAILAKAAARTDDGADFPILGIFLELLSLCCGITGKQLLRLGHLEAKRSVRAAGFLLQNVMGPVLDAAALGFAAQSILVLFGGLDAVGTLMIAPWLLGEKRTWRKIVGASFVGLGTVAAAGFGPRGSEGDRSYGLDELSGLFLRPVVGFWALGFAALALWCLREILTGSQGTASSSARRGLAFGILAGMCDGNSWCLKTVVRLLVVEHSPRITESPWFWMAALGALSSSLSAMGLLIRGTALFPTVFLVPVLDGARIVSGAASGLLVMDELRGLPPERLLGYLLAVLGVLAGIQALYADEATQLHPSDPAACQELVTQHSAPSGSLAPGNGDVEEAMAKRSVRELRGCHSDTAGQDAGKGFCSNCMEDMPLDDTPFPIAPSESTGLFQAVPSSFASTGVPSSDGELLSFHSFRHQAAK